MEISLVEFQNKVEALVSHPGLPATNVRYSIFGKVDPYPSIAPSLLHSGHIATYVVATGMIEPFHTENLRKPATYLVPLEGEVRYLNDKGELQKFYLSRAGATANTDIRPWFVLQPNSLCYVTLEPVFRIPNYLAGRFNLLIRDVYRGLLVGTGPLVDPGFNGKLSIPLHNFTSNSYTLNAGEGFVYFEFTKMSTKAANSASLPTWLPPILEDQPPFPISKGNRKNLDDYIQEATNMGPAQYALMSEIRILQESSNKVLSRVRNITGGTVIAAIIFLVTVVGVADAGFALYFSSKQFDQAAQTTLSDSIKKVEERINQIQSSVENIQKDNLEMQKKKQPSKKR